MTETPLSGAVLISPWVVLESSEHSMEANKKSDILSAASLTYWAQNFLGGAALDAWNNPLQAPMDWWDSLPVKRILVTYGDKELLRDDVEALGKLLQQRHADTTVLNFSDEVHVHMIMNRFLRIKKHCKSEMAYLKWLDEHFGS